MSLPGTRFWTIEQAGIEAILQINEASIKNNWEYAGLIYQSQDGSFSFTKSVTDKDFQGSTPEKSPAPRGSTVVGTYHTHGRGGYSAWDEAFSIQDLVKADGKKRISFLGTPNLHILMYVPAALRAGEDGSSGTGVSEFFGPFLYKNGSVGPK